MDSHEVKKLVATVTATYPKTFQGYTTADIDNMIRAWEMTLGGLAYEQASNGLKVFFRSDTKGFPPSPGQVLNCAIAASETDGERVGEMEAWALVMRAVRKSGEASRAAEAFNELPAIVRATVGRPEILREMALNEDFNEAVEKGIFLKNLAAMRGRVASEKAMSAGLRSPRLDYKAEPARQIEAKGNGAGASAPEWLDNEIRNLAKKLSVGGQDENTRDFELQRLG